MTISFEIENNVIVYALEKCISYARDNLSIFVVQCVWGHSSILGLQQELVTYIDNLQIPDNIGLWAKDNVISDKETLPPPTPEIQDNQLSVSPNIHPDMISQVEQSDNYPIDFMPEVLYSVLKNTKKFIQKSQTEQQAVRRKNKPIQLHKTTFGKVAFKLLSKKERNRLQAISTNTLNSYINNRVSGCTKYLYISYKYSHNHRRHSNPDYPRRKSTHHCHSIHAYV
jgi:hypothetical protein